MSAAQFPAVTPRDRFAADSLRRRLLGTPEARALDLAQHWDSFPANYSDDQVALAAQLLVIAGAIAADPAAFRAPGALDQFAEVATAVLAANKTQHFAGLVDDILGRNRDTTQA